MTHDELVARMCLIGRRTYSDSQFRLGQWLIVVYEEPARFTYPYEMHDLKGDRRTKMFKTPDHAWSVIQALPTEEETP